jgi:hypothetical protein
MQELSSSSQEKKLRGKMLGQTILRLGSAVRSHAVVNETRRDNTKTAVHTHSGLELMPISHDNCTINVPSLKRSPTAPCDEVRKRERVECGSD